ncbi:hypothetical protein OG21DRAFT_1512160 [Imleria badia]|nr:hypothetical protein OG21DRAFT_1512160 [Imleria badia]
MAPQLLMIMSSSIAYLTSRSTFLQVSPEIPVTKSRNQDKFDPPEVFEANKRELVDDLIVKAKQIEVLIQSLPVPEPEETQASLGGSFSFPFPCHDPLVTSRPRRLVWFPMQAHRLDALEAAMTEANEEYVRAVDRASS